MLQYLEAIDYKGLFVLYLIISINFANTTFACKLQKLLTESMLAKHIVGFFTLYFFVIVTSPPRRKSAGLLDNRVLQAIILYALFMISSRCDTYFLAIFLIGLGINFIINSYLDGLPQDSTEISPDTEHKLHQFACICAAISVCALLIGFILFYGEKRLEYGTKFQFGDFLFGNPHCRHKVLKLHNYRSMLLAAFHMK